MLKGAQRFARHMVVENGAQLQGAPRVLKGVPLSARDMAEGKGVHSKVVGFAPRVSMEGPISVWHMVVVRDVQCLIAQRVPGDGLIFVSDMVEARDANMKDVVRVLKGAQTSARHMGEERGALGVIPGQSMAINLLVLVTLLPGARRVSVHSTVVWYRTREFMVVSTWDLLCRTQSSANLRS